MRARMVCGIGARSLGIVVILALVFVYLLTAALPEAMWAESEEARSDAAATARSPAAARGGRLASACPLPKVGADAPPMPPPPAWQRATAARPQSTGAGVEGSALSIALRRAREYGFQPRYILDVGANSGGFAMEAWSVFGRDADPPPLVLMFEGAAARAPSLAAVGFDFVIAVMGACTRHVDWFVSDTAHTGNSVLRENSQHFATIAPAREVMRRVDELLAVAPALEPSGGVLDGPALLKLDVQGYELEVLKGAARALEATEMLLLEVAVLPYNRGSPLVTEVLAAVGALGFDVLDLTEVHGAGPNGQLFQLDFSFVRRGSPLFKRATEEAMIIVS